jgi:hypothetical protein
MILTKEQYIASINNLLPDNSQQLISPLDLRTSLINLIDSVPNFFDGDPENFSTPEYRNTVGGILALSKVELAGHSSYDSSAFGYAALRNNYNGEKNTAIGSYALSCNLYGSDNVALGFSALTGKVTGSGNVALGNLALANSKNGDFNIGIGHGAGYYIGQQDNYKLYIASVSIDTEGACTGGEYSDDGPPPLIYGDLNPVSHRFGIATKTLHGHGTLQVSGDITPTDSSLFNLGNTNRSFESVNEQVYFSGGRVGILGYPSGTAQLVSDAALTVYGDLLPSESGMHALGHPSLPWDGHFNDVIVSGQLIANDVSYNKISECLYECKVLHLATSGFCDPDGDGFHNDAVCGFLTDEGLDGAGFVAHSSGTDYQRDYNFIYKFPDSVVDCLEFDDAYSRSRWQSNISIQIESGRHLQTDRIINNNARDKFSIVHQSGCAGIFMQPNIPSGLKVTIGAEAHVNNDYPVQEDINFISRSGTYLPLADPVPEGYDYGVMYGSVDSGVDIKQKFASRIRSTSSMRGFEIIYHDERDIISTDELGGGPVPDPED